MERSDDWGRDPAVRQMRRIFAVMEEGQRELLRRAGLSALDPRLRQWRQQALDLFHRAWARGSSVGGPEGAGEVYTRCLAEVLVAEGLRVKGTQAGEGPR